MSSRNDVSDDYVADLLKQDAKKTAIKYSTLGLETIFPRRPTASAPKPNTKFLKNILQETDTHNTALKVKELGDAARRLRGLREDRDIVSDQRSKHRLEKEDSDNDYHYKKRKREGSEDRSGRHRRRSSPRREGREKDRRTRHSRRDSSADSDGQRFQDRKDYRRHRHERRRSNSREKRRRYSHSRSRSRSPRDHKQQDIEAFRQRDRHRHSSPTFDIDAAFTQARRHQSTRKDTPKRSKIRSNKSGSPKRQKYSHAQSQSPGSRKTSVAGEESDPLEAIIGPVAPPSPPKVHLRGRGALAASSGIDSRFAQSYDPATDVQVDEGLDDDWDLALEALKDRQRWKQQGADRLRAAGFTNEEVDKWENGGEKREEDVVWKKKGEGREWDRGKVVDGDGQVVLEPPEWGRLKGT